MSSYGKCMGFPINFSQYGKMQQNPSYGVNLRYWYSYFSNVWVIFISTIPILRYTSSYGKCMGFPINAIKLIVWGEPGKSGLILFPYYGSFFSIRFPFYGILHHMKNACIFSLISHNMGKDSQTHRMGKVWEISSLKYPTKPIVYGETGNWYSYFSHSVGAFLPLDYHFVVYFIICKIHGFPHQFPIAWENRVKFIKLGEPRKLVPIFFP